MAAKKVELTNKVEMNKVENKRFDPYYLLTFNSLSSG
jgi:hypothetical protein